MSKLQQRITSQLSDHGIDFDVQIPVPLDNYPWKTLRTKTPPKSDIYLPEFELYIEVKGFMTYRAVSKLSYLSRKHYRYYIFQGTEPQWNPFIHSYLPKPEVFKSTKKGEMDAIINFQIEELINLEKAPKTFINDISTISLERLKNYVTVKIDEYKEWNGEWY